MNKVMCAVFVAAGLVFLLTDGWNCLMLFAAGIAAGTIVYRRMVWR